MNAPNPPANFDPSCAILVETSPDPEKGASTSLAVAVCDGYAPTISWLVMKENGEQAIVVLMARASRVGAQRIPNGPSWIWAGGQRDTPGSVFVFVALLMGIAAGCVITYAVVG